jgi:hypothetical protein
VKTFNESDNLHQTLTDVAGVRDDTGALADVLVDKYLTGFQLGNFTDMIPGLMDVSRVSLKLVPSD